MKKYSKEELIKALIDYSKKIGRTPKMKEVAGNEELPPINQFLKKFGRWNNTLIAARLNINAIGEYKKGALLRFLKESYSKLGRSPILEEFRDDKDKPSPYTYYRVFGSWNNALKLAGLEINVRKDYSDKELLDILKNLRKKLGRTPMMKDLNIKKNLPEATIFKDHFGSWNNALRTAGLEVKYQFRKWTKEEVIDWLRKKYGELGKTPGIRDFDKDPNSPAKNTVRKLFGNWTNAIRQAKIPVKRFNSKEELIKSLQKLYSKLNRTPTREELKLEKGCPSLTPFVEKFGSYTAACLRAGLTPNDGRNNKIWQSWQKHCEDMANVIYKNIEIQKEGIVDGVPDIYVPDKNLFIDAKTCGYKDFKGQIKKYCKNNNKLEFWLIFEGIETKRKKVRYVYAEEIAKHMVKLGRKDLAIKCRQFVRNVYSEEQSILT